MTTKCDVASWTGSWDRKKTVVEKLGKSEQVWSLFNNTVSISVSHEGESDEGFYRNSL